MDNTEISLLEMALRHLDGLGLAPALAECQKGGEVMAVPDARIRIGGAGAQEWRQVEVKHTVTAAMVGAVAAQLRAFEGRPLLVTNYLTPPVAERLHDMDIEYVDAAGNAYVKLKNTLIWIAGRPRAKTKPGNSHKGRAFEPSGLQVLFALLCDPDCIALPYRKLAHRAGVAHGTVGWVFEDLAARGFLAGHGNRGKERRLFRTRQLAQQWIEAYARTLRPTLLLGRYRTADGTTPATAVKLLPGMQMGGELAAARVTGYLKPATATVWTDKIDPKFIVTNRLTTDRTGNIEVMRKFWDFQGTAVDQVPDLLTYADLLAIGDARTLETARLTEAKVFDRLVG